MQAGLVGIFWLLGPFECWATVKFENLKIHEFKFNMLIFAKHFSIFLKFLDGSGLISIILEAVNLLGKSAKNDKNEDCQN